MTRINGPRIFLGGLLAGVVINTFEFVTNFFVLNEAWVAAKALPAVGPPMAPLDVAALNLWGFLVGLLAIWLYAAIRDTYGRGPKTAVKAGTVVWVLAVLFVVLRPSVGPGLPITAWTRRRPASVRSPASTGIDFSVPAVFSLRQALHFLSAGASDSSSSNSPASAEGDCACKFVAAAAKQTARATNGINGRL